MHHNLFTCLIVKQPHNTMGNTEHENSHWNIFVAVAIHTPFLFCLFFFRLNQLEILFMVLIFASKILCHHKISEKILGLCIYSRYASLAQDRGAFKFCLWCGIQCSSQSTENLFNVLCLPRISFMLPSGR